jgi:Fur family transcriptional regulator, ferric uptake regulator
MPASHPIHEDSKKDALLKILLKTVGLKVTASRLVVLAYFYHQFQAGQSAPISHAELTERLPQKGLDKVTIYRNLNDLAQANLLLKHSLGDTLWRYSYHHVFCASYLPLVEKYQPNKPNQAHHHLHAHPHFVCSQCSQLTCLPFENKEIPAAWAFQIGLIEEITVRGLCQSCHHQRR